MVHFGLVCSLPDFVYARTKQHPRDMRLLVEQIGKFLRIDRNRFIQAEVQNKFRNQSIASCMWEFNVCLSG